MLSIGYIGRRIVRYWIFSVHWFVAPSVSDITLNFASSFKRG